MTSAARHGIAAGGAMWRRRSWATLGAIEEETMAGLLEGHLAAVTGGASGIGQGISRAYAEAGARVIVLDTNPEGAKETVDLITAAGGKASAVKLDVTDRQACR